MKKIIYFASAACILAVAVSCQNDIYENTVPEEAVVFTGIIDNSPATRTTLDNYYVYWTEGDQVYIAGTSGTTFTATSTGANTKFSSTSGSVGDAPYTAIYPASYYQSGSYVMPASLTYASSSFNVPMYGYADPSNDPTTLTFKNVFSVLKITVPQTVMVEAVAVESSFNPINGTFTISSNYCAEIASGGTTTTLDCDVDGNGKGIHGTDFYIPVPAGDYTGNLTVSITTVGESTTGSASRTTTQSISMARNTIYGLSGIIKEGSFSLNNGSTIAVQSSGVLL